jgi:hypothetical protein
MTPEALCRRFDIGEKQGFGNNDDKHNQQHRQWRQNSQSGQRAADRKKGPNFVGLSPGTTEIVLARPPPK